MKISKLRKYMILESVMVDSKQKVDLEGIRPKIANRQM